MKASVPTIEKLTQILENKADKSDLIILSNERKINQEEYMEKLNTIKSQVDSRVS